MNNDLIGIKEGKTKLLVPSISILQKIPPKMPVFFNPRAKGNRDMSIFFYRAYSLIMGARSFADPLCGTGSRGVRVAVEIPSIEKVSLNDINPIAIDFAKRNALINDVVHKCDFSVKEVCHFMIPIFKAKEERYDIIDVDPFGSPITFVDCILRNINRDGLVSFTATDTAVLCGVYPQVCYRKYHGWPLRNEYANEIALRLLISSIAFAASKYDMAITPIFSHSDQHYLRTYVKVMLSSHEANKLGSKVGLIKHCSRCGNRETLCELTSRKCDFCGGICSLGGPLWKDNIQDKSFLELARRTNTSSYPNEEKIHNLLDVAIQEVDFPTYFQIDKLASAAKTSPPKLNVLIEKLRNCGFLTSKTILDTQGLKTNARVGEIITLIK